MAQSDLTWLDWLSDAEFDQLRGAKHERDKVRRKYNALRRTLKSRAESRRETEQRRAAVLAAERNSQRA